MRLDLLLVRLRLVASRKLAQDWIGAGHMRRNGVRVIRANQPVAAGDVLTLPMCGPMRGPMRADVKVIEILALPLRRGPASEAQACYRTLDAGAAIAIADTKPPPSGTVQAERIEGKSLT